MPEGQARPPRPWHPIRGGHDASTMWYAVMIKQERVVYSGTLCFRHVGRQNLLEAAGWIEVPWDVIGVDNTPVTTAP